MKKGQKLRIPFGFDVGKQSEPFLLAQGINLFLWGFFTLELIPLLVLNLDSPVTFPQVLGLNLSSI